MEKRILSDRASQAWEGFVGSQAPADFMRHLWAMGYLTVEAAADAYEANIPLMFPCDAELETAGVGKLLAEYIRWALPDIEPAGRTNPAAVDALKHEIANMVNRRQHAQADHLAARGAEHMDHETLQAFVAWAVALGIRDVSEWSAGDTLAHTPPRTDPAAVETLKQAIVALINRRRHAEAEHLADRGCEDMDPETAEAFVAWCAELGIR